LSHSEWDFTMATQRAHVALPAELIEEIDALVGPRQRSAFIAEVAAAEVRKRRLLEFLRSSEPVWKDEDHPELVEMGTARWVESLRNEKSTRLEGRDKNLDAQ
jgi:hypothetical protein